MAHEMDVPIADEALSYGAIVERIERKWRTLRSDAAASVTLTIQNRESSNSDRDVRVGKSEARIDVFVSEIARAQCDFRHFPREPAFNDIENSRVQANVSSWREPESTLVMALVAGAIAEIAETFVVDELNCMTSGRIVQSTAIDSKLATVTSLPLRDAAQMLFGRLWSRGQQ